MGWERMKKRKKWERAWLKERGLAFGSPECLSSTRERTGGWGGRTRDRGGEGDRDGEKEKQGQAKMKARKAPVGVVSHVVTGSTCVRMTP